MVLIYFFQWNIVNNNSVAQETSTEDVFTETVQDTQTQN